MAVDSVERTKDVNKLLEQITPEQKKKCEEIVNKYYPLKDTWWETERNLFRHGFYAGILEEKCYQQKS